jgi:RNA polymerase sigma-70 factor (ECF subfamily)|nr:MAG TPA: positive control sigma-like factor [Caudoviricetes sp.]
MKDLLIAYRKTRLDVLNKIKEINEFSNQHTDDLAIYKGILKDLEYVIEWLKTGHQPGNYNAIDKSQCYLVDQQVIEKACAESMYKKVSDVEYYEILNDINNPISYALMKLTPIELECFIMVKCEGLSESQCAELINIKKNTVHKYLARVKKKIQNELSGNLFIS